MASSGFSDEPPSDPIERAIEFAKQADDNHGSIVYLRQAQIIIFAVMGVGKTSVCEVLAQRGLIAANVPITKERPTIEGLKEIIDEERTLVVGLTCFPKVLLDRLWARELKRQKLGYFASADALRSIITTREEARDLLRTGNLAFDFLEIPRSNRINIGNLTPEQIADKLVARFPLQPLPPTTPSSDQPLHTPRSPA